MAEKIQLQNRVMQEFEGKVRGDNVTFGVVGRVLDGRKVVNVVFFRNNHNAARMLTGAFFDAGAAVGKALFLGFVDG